MEITSILVQILWFIQPIVERMAQDFILSHKVYLLFHYREIIMLYFT